MNSRRFQSLSQACQLVRPISVFLVATAVVSIAMAMEGWQMASGLLAALIVMVGVLLVIQMYRSLSQLRDDSLAVFTGARKAEHHYVDVLRRIVGYVESRDKFHQGHSERVGRTSGQMAEAMGMDEGTVGLMTLAGQLHDLGLLAVSEQVLADRGHIGADAYRNVQKHAEVGYEVLSPLQMLQPVLPAILHHHERMNGTGYPKGLVGEAIPLEARILAVADAFDAMTHDRPHRPALSQIEALGELRRCAPHGYDPACVEALAKVRHLPAARIDPLGLTAACA